LQLSSLGHRGHSELALGVGLILLSLEPLDKLIDL